ASDVASCSRQPRTIRRRMSEKALRGSRKPAPELTFNGISPKLASYARPEGPNEPESRFRQGELMTIRKTVHFTGMDGAEQQALNDLFQTANKSLGGGWHIDSEADAGVLVVDVDSIYGHMTWLKVHNSGRTIVALTSHGDADADHVLNRPVSAEALAGLLQDLESG